MSVDRLKNASKSFVWMMVSLVIVSVMPFVVRTIMIKYLGDNYVGLNSFFISILQVLSISELGIGDAIVYYLYAPMSKKNIDDANKLLNLYKYAFRIIGLVIIFIAMLLIPFLPFLIKKDIPADINIYVLYFFYILDLLISYFCKSYCTAIFQSNQSLYYKYKCESIIRAICFGLQIVFLISFKSYYGYTVMIPVATITLNLCLWRMAKKYYPSYKPEGKLSTGFYKSFWIKVSSMAIMKLRNVFRNSIDSLVISSFIGLGLLAKYNNYYVVMAVPIMFMTMFSQAMLQSLGNSVAEESIESNRGVIKMYSFLLQLVVLILSSGLICLYNIFITLWIGEQYTFSEFTVILFGIYFYLLQISSISGLIRNSTGIWNVGKWIPIVETLLNLILDIILIQYYKQDGVLIGTIVSLALINIPFETTVVFREYFKEKPFKVLGDYLLNGIVAAGIIYVCYCVTGLFMPEAGIVTFVVKGVVCVAISVGLFVLVHIRDSRLKDLVGIFRGVLEKKD